MPNNILNAGVKISSENWAKTLILRTATKLVTSADNNVKELFCKNEIFTALLRKYWNNYRFLNLISPKNN